MAVHLDLTFNMYTNKIFFLVHIVSVWEKIFFSILFKLIPSFSTLPHLHPLLLIRPFTKISTIISLLPPFLRLILQLLVTLLGEKPNHRTSTRSKMACKASWYSRFPPANGMEKLGGEENAQISWLITETSQIPFIKNQKKYSTYLSLRLSWGMIIWAPV